MVTARKDGTPFAAQAKLFIVAVLVSIASGWGGLIHTASG